MKITSEMMQPVAGCTPLYKVEYPITLVDMYPSFVTHTELNENEAPYVLVMDSDIIDHIIAKTLILSKREIDYLSQKVGSSLDANFYVIKTDEFLRITKEVPYSKMEDVMVVYLSINEINQLITMKESEAEQMNDEIKNPDIIDVEATEVTDVTEESTESTTDAEVKEPAAEDSIVYDADRDAAEETSEKDPNTLYDLDDEIKKKEEDFMKDAKTDDENSSEEDEETVSEEQPNVFEKGLHNGEFLLNHSCPMCGIRKKSISELYSQKRFRPKKVVGYMSICANCGFVSIYATDANQLLKYLRGKAI